MTRVSVTELKARLSAFLEIVRQGEEVLVTDRGRLIARLAPVAQSDQEDDRRELLMQHGRLRAPTKSLPKDFLKRALPADPAGRSLKALLDERESGW